VPEQFRNTAAECADMIRDHAELHGMVSTGQQCDRILLYINREPFSHINIGVLRDDVLQLKYRLVDDLESHCFLHLDYMSAKKYRNPLSGWDEVLGRFDAVRYNIEESNKCFALDRFGAAVFHILLVAEYGVIQLAELLEVNAGHPGWGQVKPLQELIKDPYPKRTTLAQTHSKLLEAVVPLLYQVKESWRHKISHVDSQLQWVDTDFSPNVATEIMLATRGFMRKLAADLPR
jgi:hypothetical protein